MAVSSTNSESVLVTGGAGFIGSYVVDELLRQGYHPVVVDMLHPQVHPEGRWPSYLAPGIEKHRFDVRQIGSRPDLLANVQYVIHLAARVGVGQSAYELEDYTSHNVMGTAALLQAMTGHEVSRFIVAGSMSSYGEGMYLRDGSTQVYEPHARHQKDLLLREFELLSEGHRLSPIPTRESTRMDCSSYYAWTKRQQEELSLLWGDQNGVPTVACRFFNTYGPRQALGNPYTGVGAIFTNRIRARKAPVIFEDGKQSRDFIYVEDVASAVVGLMKTTDTGAVNIGTGHPTTIKDLARALVKLYLGDEQALGLDIRGLCRTGDIRHCFANVEKLRKMLPEWEPRPLMDGLRSLKDWAESQPQEENSFEVSYQELIDRNLLI